MSVPTPARAAPRAVVFCCFFLSGASTLIYEIVWMRQLLLVLGNTTSAVSAVLCAFMLGLAAGAALFGRLADRSPNPLRAYGWLEAGIGTYALLLPGIVAALTPGWVHLARTLPPGALLPVRLLLAVALLAPATLLMGATFPVMVGYVRGSGFGRTLGLLYGTNVVGAVTGCLLSGFVLIRAWGLGGATGVAVLINLAIAVVAIVASRNDVAPGAAGAGASPALVEEGAGSGGAGLPRWLIWGAVFLSGFVTMGFEVLWTRILVFSFNSTVYLFSVILATFLAGLAIGSWAYALLQDRIGRERLLGGAMLGGGLLSLGLVTLTPSLYDMSKALSAQLGFTGGVQLLAMALASLLVMLVPTICMGMVFPLGSRMLASEPLRVGRLVGSAYTVNTLGAVAGSLAVGFGLVPLLGLRGCVWALAGLEVAAGVLALRHANAGRGLLPLTAAALAAAGLLHSAVLSGPNPFDPMGRHFKVPVAVEAHRDGVTASVTVARDAEGNHALRIDGFEAAADDEGRYSYMKLMTHIPMLLHPDPKDLLVISFGTGTTAGSGLLHPGVRVDAVDINPDVLRMAPYFEAANHGVSHDPRARLIVDDGRNYVLVTERSYDVITSEPMPPTFAGIVNLYSREYYQLAKARLRPGGFLVQWLPFHLLTLEESWQIVATVMDVFPGTTVWLNHRTGIIVAPREGRLVIDPARLERALADGPLAEDMAEIGARTLPQFLDLYSVGPETLAEITRGFDVVTDEHPRLEFHAWRHNVLGVRNSFHKGEVEALMTLFTREAAEPLPLPTGAPEAWGAERAAASHRDAGRLALAIGRPELAEKLLLPGLAFTEPDVARLGVLWALADVALERKRPDDAGRWLAEMRAIDPAYRGVTDVEAKLSPR